MADSNAPAAPAVPPGKVRVDFVADAKNAMKKPSPTEPVKAAPVATPEPVAPKAEVFEKLAQEREALRKQAEEIKARAARYESLEKAIAAKDARALLGLAGVTPEELTRSLSGATGVVEVAKKEEPAAPAVEALRKELDEMKAAAAAAQARETQVKLVGVVQNHLKELAASLPLSSRLADESAKQALEIMESHFKRTGKNLADDARESIKLALEIVEERHQEVVKKYGLTASEKQASIVPEASEAPHVESAVLTQRDERPTMTVNADRALTAQEHRERVKAALRKHSPGA